MADALPVTCPSCRKRIIVPAEFVGRKIRCKSCGTTFVAGPARPAAARSASAAARPPAARSAPARPPEDDLIIPFAADPKPSPVDDDEVDADKGYGLVTIDLDPRCPHCTQKLEEENQVVCLNCGYNLRARVRKETVVVYGTTGWQQFVWLLPGIVCVLVPLVLITGCVFLTIYADEWLGPYLVWEGSEQGYFVRPGIASLYASLFTFFVTVGCSRFAWKRLVVNPKPPEVEKR